MAGINLGMIGLGTLVQRLAHQIHEERGKRATQIEISSLNIYEHKDDYTDNPRVRTTLDYIRSNTQAGRITASRDLGEIIDGSDIILFFASRDHFEGEPTKMMSSVQEEVRKLRGEGFFCGGHRIERFFPQNLEILLSSYVPLFRRFFDEGGSFGGRLLLMASNPSDYMCDFLAGAVPELSEHMAGLSQIDFCRLKGRKRQLRMGEGILHRLSLLGDHDSYLLPVIDGRLDPKVKRFLKDITLQEKEAGIDIRTYAAKGILETMLEFAFHTRGDGKYYRLFNSVYTPLGAEWGLGGSEGIFLTREHTFDRDGKVVPIGEIDPQKLDDSTWNLLREAITGRIRLIDGIGRILPRKRCSYPTIDATEYAKIVESEDSRSPGGLNLIKEGLFIFAHTDKKRGNLELVIGDDVIYKHLPERIYALSKPKIRDNSAVFYAASACTLYQIVWDFLRSAMSYYRIADLQDIDRMTTGLSQIGGKLIVRKEYKGNESYQCIGVDGVSNDSLQKDPDLMIDENDEKVYMIGPEGELRILDLESSDPNNYRRLFSSERLKGSKEDIRLSKRGEQTVLYTTDETMIFDAYGNLIRYVPNGFDVLFAHDRNMFGFRSGRLYKNNREIMGSLNAGEYRTDIVDGDHVFIVNRVRNRSNELFFPQASYVTLARCIRLGPEKITERFRRPLMIQNDRGERVNFYDARCALPG